ncbi:MAG: hypothetical protein QF464_03225, partial [Myxococcota bacterium]|nr:hypothetical protein [Myxococcota bacterium]
MSQRVEYEALPGTRYDQYVPKVRTLTRFLGTPEATKFKVFRDFLRQQGLWDREKSPTMLSLVDLSWDRQGVNVGKLAQQFADAESDDAARDLLFERLKQDNI